MAPITIIPKACSCCKGERSSRDKSSNLPLPNILYEGSEGSTCLRQAGSKGGGSGSAAGLLKSALRDLLSVSYDIVSILVISRCAVLSYLAALFFFLFGGQNKSLYAFL